MADRCKIGDIALIIRDEAGCEDNIGRMVNVLGPKRVASCGATTWLIEPVIGTRITYIATSGKVTTGKAILIEHWDQWLLPIRPEAGLEEVSESNEVFKPRELEAA
jgi:hypothetical protein